MNSRKLISFLCLSFFLTFSNLEARLVPPVQGLDRTGAASLTDITISSCTNNQILKYNSASAAWTCAADATGGAPTDATYITQVADATLTAEQALSTLATGYMKVTTATGVVSSQAVPIPVADGGTNSITALNNGRIMISSGGAIIERAALTASALTVGDAVNGLAPLSLGTANQLLGMNSGASANEYKTLTDNSAPPDLEVTHSANSVVVRPRGWNPRRTFFAMSDFLGHSITSSLEQTNIGLGANVTAAFVDNEMGDINNSTAGSSGDGAILAVPGLMDFDTNTTLLIRIRFNETTARRIFIGVSNEFTSVPPTTSSQCAGFVLDSAASANFRVRTCDADGVSATETDYSPTTAADTAYHTFKIARTADGVVFAIDNSADHTITTDLPGAAVQLQIVTSIIATEALSKTYDWSYWAVWRTGMSR